MITEKLGISAMHCFTNFIWEFEKLSTYLVLAGLYDKVDSNTQTSDVLRFWTTFDTRPYYELHKSVASYVRPDICIFEVKTPFKLNKFVQPACLPSKPVDIESDCFASGWGTTRPRRPSYKEDLKYLRKKSSLKLQVVKLQLLHQDLCEKNSLNHYQEPKFLRNYEICTEPGPKDTCSGDSGGPLICTSDGNAVLHGVTSWGFGCAQPDLPGGNYANVYPMLDFIHDVMDDGHVDRIKCKSNVRHWGNGRCNRELNTTLHCFDGGDCNNSKE